jgi:hypothetical protein
MQQWVYQQGKSEKLVDNGHSHILLLAISALTYLPTSKAVWTTFLGIQLFRKLLKSVVILTAICTKTA